MTSSLLSILETIPDPRNKSGRRHPASIVLVIAISAVISQIYSIRGIEAYIKRHRNELLAILPVSKHGLPSFSSLRRVLLNLDFDALAKALKQWFIEQKLVDASEWFGLDGKAIKSTVSNGVNNKQDFAVIVSAFSHLSGIALFSAKFSSKESSEIAIVETLIKDLEIENRIFTLDALHCKKNS